MRSAIRIGVSLLLVLFLTGAKPESPKKAAPRKLAILLFEGVQIIDYTGPYEVFRSSGP